MNSRNISDKEQIKSIKKKVGFENIKSNVILKIIFNCIEQYILLKVIKHNKRIQKRLNININDYDEYSKIEIEIKFNSNEYGKFINFPDKEEEYYHIYFDN